VAVASLGCPDNVLSGRYNVLAATNFNSTGTAGNIYQYSYIMASCGGALCGYCCSGILGVSASPIMAANGTQCFEIIEKVSGKFVIPHPDPEKTHTHKLFHSFVETPTNGDTLYRYEITAINCQARFELPDYFKFLNRNIVTKVSPLGHFGRGYVILDDDLTGFDLCANNDGKYNVFLLGTRKDKASLKNWRGAEQMI